MKIITTSSRLILREFTIEDAINFFNLNKDPKVIKYTGDPPFKSILEAKIFIQNYSAYKDNGYGRWAVCLKEGNEFIGFCGLKFHTKEKITEVGYRFFKNQWNKGYATESTLACLSYGFSELNLNEIYAHVHIKNYASQRVIKKCGLHFVKDFFYNNQLTNLYCIKKDHYYESKTFY